MRKSLLVLLLLPATIGWSQSKDAKSIAAAVEQLNQALVAADSNALKHITADALSYGHSSGKVEDQQAFVDNVVNGPLKLLSITTTDQSIKLAKRTAVVRHLFNAKATNNGTPTELKIGVLQVWQKKGRAWKLLARQGFKV